MKNFRILVLLISLVLPTYASAWFDTDWIYKASFVATNPGVTLIDQQVQINLTAANVHPDYVWSSDGDDIRARSADDLTALDYYIENWNAVAETATIYVRVASLPPGDTTIHLYYGNPLAPDASDPIGVLTEVGLRYHTRQSTFDPTSRATALAEFNSISDGITGYGCATVTEFTSISNGSVFPGGSSTDILFFSNNHFEVAPADVGTWNFRFAGDYGRGGAMYLDNADSDEKWNDDLWWGFNWGNTAEILQVSASLSSGFHNLQMLGAEGGNDGGTSVEFQSPSNPGVWRVWSTANVNIRSEKCEVVSVPATTTSSTLVTSTKTALDLNGGDLEIGDVVRYIITLNESSGNPAEHVSVTDNIAPQLGSLVIQSIPAGATDNSVPGGGINSTGLVDISDITVPASGSVSIIFDVTVATVPVGQTIDNSATIVNPSGALNVVVNAPTLTVNVNSPTVAGVKSLYLYSDNSLSRVVPLTDQSFVLIDEAFDSETWTLSPALQAPLTVDKSIDQSIALYMRRAGEVGYNIREIRIRVAGSISGVFAEFSDSNVSIPGGAGFSLFSFTLTYSNATPLTLAAGETITLEIINESNDFISGGAGPVYNDDIEVYRSNTSGSTPNTVLSFPSSTVINVDSVETYDAAYPLGVLKSTFSPGDTVYIRPVVSDPFGFVDINSATVTIVDADSNTVLAPTTMTSVLAATSLRTYEYAYNIVGIPPQGAWSATVLSNEGTEGTISDTGIGSFSVVLPPSLMTVVSSNISSASPGDTVIYTIVTTNTGTGDAISVEVTDDLPPFTSLRLNTYGASTPFSCITGCPGSGLTIGTPLYSNDDATTYVYTPVSGAGGAPANYDADVTHWQIPMTGALPGGAPSFTIRFEVIIQ